MDRSVPDKQFGVRRLSGNIMKLHVLPIGYYQVTLTKYGVQRPSYVHRLVAETFIPNPNNLPEIDHIDAVRTNNKISNLRWVTRRENNDHVVELGHHYDGTSNFYDPITREHLSAKRRKPVTRSDGTCYESIHAAAEDLNVASSAIRRVLNDSTHRARCRGYGFVYSQEEIRNAKTSS